MGAIACSKTPWGEKTISEINDVLRKLRTNSEYKKILETWLVPKTNSEDYWINYKNKVENVK